MSDLFNKIHSLIRAGEILISEHGYDQLTEDNLSIRELLKGVANGTVIEEYPNYPKGPCILLFQQEQSANPVHVVWGITKGLDKPAVLVTAYRPDPERWDENFLRRKKL